MSLILAAFKVGFIILALLLLKDIWMRENKLSQKEKIVWSFFGVLSSYLVVLLYFFSKKKEE